jgi:hypothetical protein
MPNPSSPKPKRGAPLGNKNRQRHGFYARRPAADPVGALDATPDATPAAPPPPGRRLSLDLEISYLRAHILRTAIIGATTVDLKLSLDLLHALSFASTALTRLIHTENWLSQTTGAQVQIDGMNKAIDSLQGVSESIMASRPHRSPSPAVDLDAGQTRLADRLKELGIDLPAGLLDAYPGSLPAPLDRDLDYPAPGPKLPADSPDHAPDSTPPS